MDGPREEEALTGEEGNVPAPAALVMRLRRLTGAPVLVCKRQLERLHPSERALAVEIGEREGGGLHDPIEHDPSVRPLFLAACDKAATEAEEWHQQRIAELRRTSPDLVEMLARHSGIQFFTWKATKRIMQEEYGIAWRTPVEMNPECPWQ